MKNIAKIVSLALVVVLLCVSLTACGSSIPTIANTYNTIKVSHIDAMGWYAVEYYSLQLNDNDTYQLIFHTNRFGGEDYDMRGVRTITYTGKYSSAPSADGELTHLDVTLEPASQITWEQHGKGFTRVETMPGVFFVNTSAWTDTMTAVYDPEGNTKGAEDFLAQFAKTVTLTVENPSLDLEDTTLTYRIVTLPDLGITYGVEG